MPGDPIQIGPFVGGLNTFSDPTAVADNEAVQLENFELDLDGSLVSRPPIVDRSVSMPLGATGNFTTLGYFYAAGGVAYLLASDGLNSTYYFNGSTWVLVTNTISATAMAQFNSQAWLVAPVGSANPGGYWTPGGGFVADANMPKGDSIVVQKFRLWVALGRDAVTNGTRLYFSKSLGTVPLWPVAPDFIDVGAGDGQNIVALQVYYQSLIIFRTDSIYSFTYTSDPAAGTASLMVNGVGLADKMAIAPFEGYIYFMYDDKAYEFTNNRAQQINLKVPFQAITRTGIYRPYSVSVFNNRVIYSFYDVMFVFSLKTRTWTRWVSSVWGSIGNIITDPASAVLVSGILHSSQSVGPSTQRTNLIKNSRAGVNTTGYTTGASGAGTTMSHFTSSTDPNLPFGGVGQTAVRCITTVNPAGYIDIVSLAASNISNVTPGLPYSFSGYLYLAGQVGTVSMHVAWKDGGGVMIGPFVSANVGTTPVSSSWVRFSRANLTAPVGAVTADVYFRVTPLAGTYPVGTNYYATAIQVEQSVTVTPYLDGTLPTDAGWTYAWAGATNNSSSIATSRRYAKTLFITDGVTSEKESMHCILQTKNYNYDSAGAYKKLDFWGMDASYRGQVTAIVTPITYNYQVTWGQLLSYTWGNVGMFTWGQPISGSLAVETVRNTAGSGAMRRFTKFLKRLRFRQIMFKLDFVTDGSIESAPVRVFSLLTYVRSKERVSKTIT